MNYQNISFDKNVRLITDKSYSGTLSGTVSSWTYTTNLGCAPEFVVLNKVRYINGGAATPDLVSYVLSTNLFSLDVAQTASVFCEDAYNSQGHAPILHKLQGPIDGQTWTFKVLGADGTTVPSSGNVTVELTYIKLL